MSQTKTLPAIRGFGHNFIRYVYDDEYAAEMKCVRCGFVINPCHTLKELERELTSRRTVNRKRTTLIWICSDNKSAQQVPKKEYLNHDQTH